MAQHPADMGATSPCRRRPDGHRREPRSKVRTSPKRANSPPPSPHFARWPGPLPAERHRPPPGTRNGPARRARHRNQPPRRRCRGNHRRTHHPPRRPACRRRAQLRRPPDGHRRCHPGAGRQGYGSSGHRHDVQDHAGLPQMWADMLPPAGRSPANTAGTSRSAWPRSTDSWDESDVRIRPNKKGSRPRTKDRPSHEDAVTGRIITVDRGRYTAVVGEDSGAGADSHRRPRPRTAPLPRGGRRLRLPCGRRLGRAGHAGPARENPGPQARCCAAAPMTRIPWNAPWWPTRTSWWWLSLPPIRSHAPGSSTGRWWQPTTPGLSRCCWSPRRTSRTLPSCWPTTDHLDFPVIISRTADSDASGIDARSDDGLSARLDVAAVSELRAHLDGKVTVMLGHSGVGKSTMVNALTGAERATGGVNAVTGRGRHTSSSALALKLADAPAGSWIIDTPGHPLLRAGPRRSGPHPALLPRP